MAGCLLGCMTLCSRIALCASEAGGCRCFCCCLFMCPTDVVRCDLCGPVFLPLV